jgi:hypothetical protein
MGKGKGQKTQAVPVATAKQAKRRQRRNRANRNQKGKLTKAEIGIVKTLANNAGEKKAAVARQRRIDISIDPRRNATTVTNSNEQIMPNVSPAQTYEVPITLATVSGVMISIVSYALMRGFSQFVNNGSVPYHAYVYGTKVLANYTQNITPKLTEIPVWLSVLGQALTNKSIKQGLGKINYKFSLDTLDEATISWERILNFAGYSRHWNIGVINNGAPVNLHFQSIVAPNPYSEDLGERAFNDLISFLSQVKETGSTGMHEKVSSTLVDKWSLDASAYGCVAPVLGTGFNQLGGIGTTILHELPIRTPLLAFLSNAGTTGGGPSRYPSFVHSFAGDALFSGGMIATTLDRKQLKMKRKPLCHAVDALEFCSVLMKACSEVLRLYTETDSFKQNMGDLEFLQNIGTGMTVQELCLMMRAQLMNAYKDTVHMTQGLMPRLPGAPLDNEFVPYVSGFGTCPVPGTTEMLLPKMLVENIRSLTARFAVGGKQGKKNPLAFIPVPGQYNGDVLNAADYAITVERVGDPPLVIFPFLPPEEYVGPRRKEKRAGKEVEVPSLEEQINLIDGKGTTNFIAINDPGAINKLVTIWNRWVRRYENFFQALTTVGTDGGINILESISCTRHFLETDDEQVKKNSLDPRLNKPKGKLGATPYASRQILAYSFNQYPLAAPWERVLQYWIMPQIKSALNSNIQRSTPFQRVASAMKEPYQMAIIESDSSDSLDDQHNLYAITLTKNQFARRTEDEEFLKQAEITGRGGILGSLANAFAAPLSQMAAQTAGHLVGQGMLALGSAPI